MVHVAGQQAAAGVGHAQGAVHKHFQFHVGDLLANVCHFLQAQFPGQDHPADTLLLPELHRGPVHRIGLYRKMDFLLRPAFLHQHDQSRVGHDQGIGTVFNDRSKITQVAAHLVVVRRNIRSQVELAAVLVGQANPFADGLRIPETVVTNAQRVAGLPRIYGIGTVGESALKMRKGAGRGQQFRSDEGF